MKKMLVIIVAFLSLNSAAFADTACIDFRENAARISGRAAAIDPDYYEAGLMAIFSEGRIWSTALIGDSDGNTFPIQLEDLGARAAQPIRLETLDLETGAFSLVLSLPDAAIESLSAELTEAGVPLDAFCADQAHFALKLPTEEDPDSYIMIRLYHGRVTEMNDDQSASWERPLYSFEVGINLVQE